jgi:hypothetical protein
MLSAVFFLSSENKPINITDSDLHGLLQLCQDVGFVRLIAALLIRRQSPVLSEGQIMDSRTRILSLEEHSVYQEQQIIALQSAFVRIDTTRVWCASESRIDNSAGCASLALSTSSTPNNLFAKNCLLTNSH